MKKVFSLLFVVLLLCTPAFASAKTRYREDERNAVDREANFRLDADRNMRNAVNQLDNDRVEQLHIPILLNVSPETIYNSWGDPRGVDGERKHEGNDILAPRGAFIVSPTKAVVGATGFGAIGGIYVYTFNPGGERYYYAHLDKMAKGLEPGDVLEPGDFIGYVGTTGNAYGGVPHLHFGIYKRGAINPYPRLTQEFSLEQQMKYLAQIFDSEENPNALATQLVYTRRSLFKEVESQGIEIPDAVQNIFNGERHIATLFTRDLDVGDEGTDVLLLQRLLNTKGFIVSATGAGSPSNETTYYGSATRDAVSSFQKAYGVEPAVGYFGPLTREKLSEI